MARKLRLEYPGALYHIINHGNYRRWIFDAAATRTAFEACLFEVVSAVDGCCTRLSSWDNPGRVRPIHATPVGKSVSADIAIAPDSHVEGSAGVGSVRIVTDTDVLSDRLRVRPGSARGTEGGSEVLAYENPSRSIVRRLSRDGGQVIVPQGRSIAGPPWAGFA